MTAALTDEQRYKVLRATAIRMLELERLSPRRAAPGRIARMDDVFSLTRFPVHLGLGGTAVRLGEFDGTPGWYERYGTQYEADGADGRLVSYHTFDGSWSSWEVHPLGEELVVCVEGTMTLHQEIDGATSTVTIGPGEAVVNPAGAWHTADVDGRATALFITAGRGTQVRPRD